MSKVRLSGNHWAPTPQQIHFQVVSMVTTRQGTGEQPRWLLLTHWHVSSPACLWKGQESGIQRAFVPTTTTGAWEELSQHVFYKESLVLPRRDRGQIVGSRGWKDQTENKAPVCCRLHVWPRASHPEPQFQPLLKGRWDLEGFFF